MFSSEAVALHAGRTALTVGLLQRELVVDGGERVLVRHWSQTSVRCNMKNQSTLMEWIWYKQALVGGRR